MAPQLMATKGRSARGPEACSARATTSLPVPVSPRITTGASEAAIEAACLSTLLMVALSATRRAQGSSPGPWPAWQIRHKELPDSK